MLDINVYGHIFIYKNKLTQIIHYFYIYRFLLYFLRTCTVHNSPPGKRVIFRFMSKPLLLLKIVDASQMVSI